MIMDIVKCKRCGKIFQKMSARNVCPKCLQAEEADFLKVKARLHDYPDEDVNQLSKATGVERQLVIDFIRGGRLQVHSSLIPRELYTGCRRCGQPTLNGRFCDQCLNQLSKSLGAKDTIKKPDSPSRIDKSGFHFNNLIKKKDRP